MGKYRYDIGLGTKYSFGNELEFTGVYLDELSKLFSSTSLPVRFYLNHKSDGFPAYDEWYIDTDKTVTIEENDRLFGGELSSRILTDKKKVWMEIEDICDILKNSGASIDYNCSNHIRVNLSSIKDERYFFEIFSKLVTIFEIDMRLFYMGDSYSYRRTCFKYARTLSDCLIKYINKVDFTSPDFYYQFRHNGIALFTRCDGINLQDYEQRKLMEIRYPNGTIKAKTIQNNCNFSLKLVDAIERKVFDPEELTRKIEQEKEELFYRDMFDEPCRKDFEYLVKSISTSEEDVDDFMTQYEHILSKKPIN